MVTGACLQFKNMQSCKGVQGVIDMSKVQCVCVI